MTMICDPIPFAKLVQKILVGNYEPVMRICVKKFIINLHNLQMLFMLWIENKFSEFLAPLHKHEDLEDWRRFCPGARRLSGNGSTQARWHGGAFGGSYPQDFLCLPKFCCAQKNLL